MAGVNDFADMGLQGAYDTDSRPSGEYHSIDDVINKVIIVTGCDMDTDTENGKRTLVRFQWNEGEAETAFFHWQQTFGKSAIQPQSPVPICDHY